MPQRGAAPGRQQRDDLVRDHRFIMLVQADQPGRGNPVRRQQMSGIVDMFGCHQVDCGQNLQGAQTDVA